LISLHLCALSLQLNTISLKIGATTLKPGAISLKAPISWGAGLRPTPQNGVHTRLVADGENAVVGR
jgi:hypothetical protein